MDDIKRGKKKKSTKPPTEKQETRRQAQDGLFFPDHPNCSHRPALITPLCESPPRALIMQGNLPYKAVLNSVGFSGYP
ncbi:hypothetical protein TorRG33x02_103210 [Trema orientale]|uniref:Uncharacterized protein n=1 Tax=Trema orientale TaxID=63057 RepID=A0A2P5F824_TREOI|nr:hypothetical protein TorRG33x02_103210 [Trema orientale]